MVSFYLSDLLSAPSVFVGGRLPMATRTQYGQEDVELAGDAICFSGQLHGRLSDESTELAGEDMRWSAQRSALLQNQR